MLYLFLATLVLSGIEYMGEGGIVSIKTKKKKLKTQQKHTIIIATY